MKILVVGKCCRNLNYLNQYVEESGAELILCPSGVGVDYQEEVRRDDNGVFGDFLNRKKYFSRPLVSIVAPYDNWELANKIIQKKIVIPNFYLLGRNNNNLESLYVGLRGVTISGLGGTYSPKSYFQKSVVGPHKRHYRRDDIFDLQKLKSHILLMYDIEGNCSKNQILFGDDTLAMFREIRPLYTFIGKHNWFGYVNTGMHHNVMTLPAIGFGYLIIDTDKEWDATCVMPKITV